MDNDNQLQGASLWFGVSLIPVALFFLIFAVRIEVLGVSNDNDPGPRAFPIVLGLVLLGGGLLQIAQACRQPKTLSSPIEDKPGQHPGRRDAFLFALGLLAYLVLVPWLGYYIPTFVCAALMTWWLGARWWVAGLTACLLIAVVNVLFVGLFRVQLP